MTRLSLHIGEIAQIVHGELLGSGLASTIEFLYTDSRKFKSADKCLFIAINGVNHNAHLYIEDLYKQGQRYFLIDNQHFDCNKYPAATFVRVKNSISALQSIAQYHRNLFEKPLIAITGSNGKTIVKEWLYQSLMRRYKVYKSPKSYNSQVGVPLSLLGLSNDAELAIIEAGISQVGEMDKLEKITKPQIGIFTTIGQAHSENFESIDEKVVEKLKLFSNCEKLIYCEDYKAIKNKISSLNKPRLFSWSRTNKKAFLFVDGFSICDTYTSLNCTVKNQRATYTLPFSDDASIENAIHLICCLYIFDYSKEDIQHCLYELRAVEMRLELKEAKSNSLLINDAYSSDLDSLKIALDFLQQQKGNAKTVAILSDLQETGMKNAELYPKLMRLLDQYQVDKIVGIGPNFCSYHSLFNNCNTYKNTDQFIDHVDSEELSDSAILLKGARKFEFEKVAKLLEHKIHETVLEVDLNSISENYHLYKNLLDPNTKVMVMVKAFSYGNGSYEIAHHLEYHKADYLAVAYVDEGVALRKKGIQLPIMVLNPDISQLSVMIKYCLEPEIYSFRQLKALQRELMKSVQVDYPIHLKVETGMHRLGFDESQIDGLIEWLKSSPEMKVASIFSHLASSSLEGDVDFTKIQIAQFKDIVVKIENDIGYTFIKHILNSSGIINFPEAQFDMVRLGIGLYGIGHKQLQNCSALKSMISQIKNVSSGQSIGYDRAFMAEENIKIAIIPIGYADGLSRALSNGRGQVRIHGQKAPIIGNICMDMCMVDVNHIPDAKEGDEVVIWNSREDILSLANELGTIPYEVLTNISQRVKRVFIQH